jgi:hypothetical protein
MDVIILAIALLAIALLAIAGPTILAIVLYWRNNPDRRSSVDTGPEHFPRPAWWQPWRSIGGTGSGGGRNSGGDSGSS